MPDKRFAWANEAAMRARIASASFAQISIITDGEVHAAYAPLSLNADGAIRFHLARGHALAKRLDTMPVLASVIDDSFYVSPDWYGTDDQVPTWNYSLIEIRGRARRLAPIGVEEQLADLSVAQEALLAPKAPWTMSKLSDARHRQLVAAIVGFAIDEPVLSGTIKQSQNKSPGEAAGVVRALRALGRDREAMAIEATR